MSRRSDGLPGDFIGDLPVSSVIQPAGLPISTSMNEVLRRSVESTQYTSRAFAETCWSAGVRQSMGAVGSSTDNSAAEGFNAAFKRETLKGRKGWSNEREARLDAFRWLTRYNTRRRHSRLGQRSPIAYENDFQVAATTLVQAA
ncbi:integrase core domain-containing protein [Streptomyces sp. ISL-44]|uniref:integrase core domain-containing protein n=1 Tax=Streptomyces sp. ISL-44 TaxID=2819184 RepID=UPI001BE7739A|nr:integrase core domain-containing protein [Streptomyces sp. ISL-44]